MIVALPPRVVERIAAGEVVERPASVVKELIENALDARAGAIDVSIERGGLGRIRVADDGSGVPAEDLPLVFGAHATSKLTDVDDLQHIASFGFRGEALSSIAAVSRCRLVTAATDDGAGWALEAVAGDVSAAVPEAARRGTVVEVADLFFNTPARRAFLGAERTEAARCREVVCALSLVHPGVVFRLDVDGRSRFRGESSASLRDRVAAVYGSDFTAELADVAGSADGIAMRGLVSLPGAARSRPRAQQLFVNGRLVRDRGVFSAVRVGCKDFLPGSLQPSWILELTVDPGRVDVNVHPTKAEVRFRDREALFALVRRSVRAALLGHDLAPRVHLGPAEQVAEPPPAGHAPATGASPGATSGTAPPGHGESTMGPSAPGVADSPPRPGPGGRTEASPRVVGSGPSSGRGGDPPTPAGAPPRRSGRPEPASPLLGTVRAAARFLQVLDTYIVHESPDGLVIVDQHALHERILYARLQADLAAGRLPTQRLLVAEPIRLAPREHAVALERRAELAALGLEIDDFGPDTVAVTSVPAVLRGERLDELLVALLDPPDLHGGIPHGLDRRLFTMACHAAVRSGDPLDEAAVADLLRQGAELEHDATCPHGRPTRVVVDRTRLEQLFKRTGF